MVPTVLDALGLEPPAAVRGVTQSPIHGVSFAHTFDDPAAPDPAPHPVLRDVRAPRHRPRRVAGGVPVARALVRRGRQAVRRADHRRDADRPGRPPLGAVPRRRGPGREPQPGRAAPGQAHRADRDVVHRGRQVQRVPDRRQRRGAADGRAPAGRRAAHQVRLPARHPDAAVLGRPAGVNRPHAITADAEIPATGAEGVLLCQGSNAGGWSLYVKDGRLCYAHNYVGRATYQVCAPDVLPAGRHQLRFEFEPTGSPDFTQGKGSPGRAQLYVDGQLIAQNEFPVTTPIAFNPGGLTCGANPGSPVTAGLPGPVPLHRHAAHRHRRPLRRPHHRHRQPRCAWPWPGNRPP